MLVLLPADDQEVVEFVEHEKQFENVIVLRQPPIERRCLRSVAELRAKFQKTRGLPLLLRRIPQDTDGASHGGWNEFAWA